MIPKLCVVCVEFWVAGIPGGGGHFMCKYNNGNTNPYLDTTDRCVRQVNFVLDPTIAFLLRHATS